MDVPSEFKEFGQFFHQGIFIIFKNDEEVIAASLRRFQPEQIIRLRRFIESLLDGTHSAQGLAAIWNRAGSDWFFAKDEQVESFLRRVRNHLAG